MTDAFQCDRCEDYGGGDGKNVIYGEKGYSKFSTDTRLVVESELCDECKEGLDEVVTDYMEVSDE